MTIPIRKSLPMVRLVSHQVYQPSASSIANDYRKCRQEVSDPIARRSLVRLAIRFLPILPIGNRFVRT